MVKKDINHSRQSTVKSEIADLAYDEIQLRNGWLEHEDQQSCLSKDGCIMDGASYRFGEVKKKGFCSLTAGLDDKTGFICDRVANTWRCAQDACSCKGTEIPKNALCSPEGPYLCEGIIENAQCKDGKLFCGSMEMPDQYGLYACNYDAWVCVSDQCKCQNLLCEKSQYCRMNAYDRYFCNDKDLVESFTEDVIEFCGTCHYSEPMWSCVEEECGTADGAYFAKGYLHAIDGEDRLWVYPFSSQNKESNVEDLLEIPHFHSKDTVRTLSQYGDCVLDPSVEDHLKKAMEIPGSTGLGCLFANSLDRDDDGNLFCSDMACYGIGDAPKPVYDARKCLGGTLWCHGKDHDPVQKPAGEGYACKQVAALPGDLHGELKTWVCTQKQGCICGKTKCAENSACIDGICIDSDVLNPPVAAENLVQTPEVLNSSEEHDHADHELAEPECNAGDCLCRDIPRPEGTPEDYRCQWVNHDGKIYDERVDARGFYDWVCVNPEGCPCGDSLCRGLSVCKQQQCMCGNRIQMKDFSCGIMATSYYAGQDDKTNFCVNPDGCQYSHHSFLQLQPLNFSCNDLDEKIDGCYCGEEMIDPDSSIRCCNGEKYNSKTQECYRDRIVEKEEICRGATCKCRQADGTDLTCFNGMVCHEGQCLDPDLQFNPAKIENGYISDGHYKLCLNETCVCGNATIQRDENCFCALGECFVPSIFGVEYEDDEDVRGRYFVYNGWAFTKNREFPRFQNFLIPSLNRRDGWEQEGEFYIPEKYQTQYAYYTESIFECECSDCGIIKYYSQPFCIESDGCRCGDEICPAGVSCDFEKNHCVYNNELACPSGTESEDKNHHCGCRGTVVPPFSSGYVCSKYGWTCVQEGGCACGSVPCAQNSVCVKPGLCAEAQ